MNALIQTISKVGSRKDKSLNTDMMQLGSHQITTDFTAREVHIGAKDFKSRVVIKLKSVKSDLNEDDLYFCQYRDGYDIAYQPNYPYKTDKDFLVSTNWDGKVFVYQNINAVNPVITEYKCFEDFERDFTL